MVKFYVNRIEQNKMNLEDVPSKWYTDVKEKLDQNT